MRAMARTYHSIDWQSMVLVLMEFFSSLRPSHLCEIFGHIHHFISISDSSAHYRCEYGRVRELIEWKIEWYIGNGKTNTDWWPRWPEIFANYSHFTRICQMEKCLVSGNFQWMIRYHDGTFFFDKCHFLESRMAHLNDFHCENRLQRERDQNIFRISVSGQMD